MHHWAERVNQISSVATRIVLFLLSLAGTPVCAQTFRTPIEHVIVVVQENRTTDNLFQDQKLIANGADIQRAPRRSAHSPRCLLESGSHARFVGGRVYPAARGKGLLWRRGYDFKGLSATRLSTGYLRRKHSRRPDYSTLLGHRRMVWLRELHVSNEPRA